MKIFLHVMLVMMALTQLVRAQPLQGTSLTESKLKDYYHIESNRIAGEICLKLKNISEAILADCIIKDTSSSSSSSSLMEEFQKNITHFQDIFPFYIRFGYNDTLLKTFSSMVEDFQQAPSNGNESFLYIQQLLQKQNLNEIFEQYVKDFKKILPELEKYEANISNKSLIKWLQNLKRCTEFKCYLNGFQADTFTAKDHFVGFLQQQLMDLTISYVGQATVFAKRTLAARKLEQLRPFVRQRIMNSMQECLDVMSISENIYHLFWIPLLFDSAVSMHINDYNLSLKELHRIIKILNDKGYEKLLSDYRTNYDKFLQHDVALAYERAKAGMSEEELLQDKDFWNTFEKLKGAATFEERVSIVNAADKHELSYIRI